MTGLRSWIDEPSAPSIPSPGVCIRGWCYDEAGSPVRGMRVRLGVRTAVGRGGLPRPDVRAALQGPPSSAESGFSVCLRLPPGKTRVRLEADVEGRGWVEFQSLDLSNTWSASIAYFFRLSRFWVGVLFGRPGAWDKLNSSEQGFIFAKIDEREGGHPLRLSPHHPPKEVKLEAFPPVVKSADALPKFTIVTPSYQQAAYLEQAMLSVLDQKGVRVDYVVQDGGSTDPTADLLRRYSPRLKRWASEKDGGQADALRLGFSPVESGPDDIMAYLNSDDVLMPGALAFVADYFARHPSVDAVYGHRVLIDESGHEVGRWYAPRRGCDDLRMQDLVPQETLFWRKRIWDKVGGIDSSFHFALDWDLLLRFVEAGAKIVRLPWFLGQFRLHEHQKSQARMEEVGVPEMDRLRERSLGRVPTRAELVASMQRAQIDSVVVRSLMKRGLRL